MVAAPFLLVLRLFRSVFGAAAHRPKARTARGRVWDCRGGDPGCDGKTT